MCSENAVGPLNTRGFHIVFRGTDHGIDVRVLLKLGVVAPHDGMCATNFVHLLAVHVKELIEPTVHLPLHVDELDVRVLDRLAIVGCVGGDDLVLDGMFIHSHIITQVGIVVQAYLSVEVGRRAHH